MGVTGRYSLSHDTFMRHIFSPEFMAKNATFEPLKELFANCQAAYKSELGKAGCSCRMTPAWAQPCVSRVIEMLEDAKKNDHDTIRRFVRFISRKPDDVDIDGLGINISVGDKKYDICIQQP